MREICQSYCQRKLCAPGKTYTLATNNGENHLHGGVIGFESVFRQVIDRSKNKVEPSYLSKHMEEGYPGNLTVTLVYELTDNNELSIQYTTHSNQTTVIDLTHHSFFNLKGEGNGDVMDNQLQIHANTYTPLKEGSIPTGEIVSLDNTPLDFRQAISIGCRINEANPQLVIGQGYDYNYVFGKGPISLKKVANIKEPLSHRKMEVFTTEPGMQLYTGNYLDGSDIGKSGIPYQKRSAFCLETQHFPDSPNQPRFPSTLLHPREKFVSNTVYKFGVTND